MKQFYIITNDKKDEGLQTTREIKEYLISKGVSCVLRSEQSDVPKDTECILVLGGDGTLLQAARDTFSLEIPLIGVNLGTLGFMAEVEKQHIKEALDALVADTYTIEKRMMLDGALYYEQRDGEESVFDEMEQSKENDNQICQAHALNDVVVTRQGTLKILTYDVYVNGQFLNRYHADGVIIATPTGSTGYSMSAGGPIVEPEAKLIVLTPICPHTLSPRSIILSPEDQVEICITLGRRGEVQEAAVAFDGSESYKLVTGDRIVVKQSEKVTPLARINQTGFLETLHAKMG